MVKRSALLALCLAAMQSASAGIHVLHAPLPPQDVVLRAIVEVGTTSSCGLREAPHLIEHLLLSDTAYGDSPVDAIITLRQQGIKLSALTRSDFTEYTLEGPAAKSKEMADAMIAFLGRSSIPKSGFDREKRTIIQEVRSDDSYVSSPTFYERYIASDSEATEPCLADSIPFASYRYDAIQAVYSEFYTPAAIRLIAQGSDVVFDLDALAIALSVPKATPTLKSQPGKREPAQPVAPVGWEGVVELIVPIAGRTALPQDAANALADQIRLEVQADIRRTEQLYTARTFVEQSLRGGWIRLEVPNLDRARAPDLIAIAEAVIDSFDAGQYSNDPVWRSYGASLGPNPAGKIVLASVNENESGTLYRFVTWVWSVIAKLWA